MEIVQNGSYKGPEAARRIAAAQKAFTNLVQHDELSGTLGRLRCIGGYFCETPPGAADSSKYLIGKMGEPDRRVTAQAQTFFLQEMERSLRSCQTGRAIPRLESMGVPLGAAISMKGGVIGVSSSLPSSCNQLLAHTYKLVLRETSPDKIIQSLKEAGNKHFTLFFDHNFVHAHL